MDVDSCLVPFLAVFGAFAVLAILIFVESMVRGIGLLSRYPRFPQISAYAVASIAAIVVIANFRIVPCHQKVAATIAPIILSCACGEK